MGGIRRVVVTGLGLVTPLGVGTPHNWLQLTSGKVATTALTDPRVPRGQGEGELDLSSHFSPGDLRAMTPAITFALVAAREAVENARWKPDDPEERERTGVAVGMGMVDLNDVVASGEALRDRYSRVSPYFVPRILTNMAAGQISMKYSFEGPNHTVSTACATGAHAVGDAFRFIKSGDADVMVCGGTEASINPLGIAGFCRLRALATGYNDCPERASRPFDALRGGFVMGEGSGMMVLEEYEHAVTRGASIYGEVLGYGLTGDAHHYTAPREDGKGAVRAMARAMEEARVNPEDVRYINAHATSTPLGDAVEVRAIKSLFGDHAENLAVSSTKGATGHLLGAAGAVEAVLTVLACHAGYIPPTANLDHPGPGLDLDFVPKEAKAWLQSSHTRVALTNSFGFGGTNASLCIGSCD
ncbi:3-oxoacyl-[acyl-carrier-protein] synthase-like 1 [Homarus americanus]|uniref:3-oxoacyl-[acyl-carrier-protein] synthase n=1 Tax=Homarus americanus TaxID=6706 RepID=A0A8J5MXC1_HOMAM|nr:3-oxoacyl-[acyl-carrier-protein] synthase-like 1 [Homarus americanus]